MNPNHNVPRLALRQNEAAEALGISPRALWELTEPRGPIPIVRIGQRSIRYCVKDLETFLENQRSNGLQNDEDQTQ